MTVASKTKHIINGQSIKRISVVRLIASMRCSVRYPSSTSVNIFPINI